MAAKSGWMRGVGGMLAFGLMAVAAIAQDAPRTYRVQYVDAAPVIDGVLTTPTEWASAEPAQGDWMLLGSGVGNANNVPDSTNNRFAALWDDNGLYLQHQVDSDGWDERGYVSMNWVYQNINLYLDPNTDGESNGQMAPTDTGVDGYQLSFNQPLGQTERLEVGLYVEAHVNALFGDHPDPWSNLRNVVMMQSTSNDPAFGYTELFIPWSDFDATNPDEGSNPETDDVGLYHPEAPLDGETWFFNIGRNEDGFTLPAWVAEPGSPYFAARPHGILQFSKGSSLLGDFNGDGELTAIDINLLTAQVRSEEPDVSFDLNGDALVTDADRSVWVETLKYTYFGDANLDGQFSSADFVKIFVAGQYEDGLEDNSVWETGDWNGDGDFASSDFVKAFVGGGYEKGQRVDAVAVPEPAGLTLLLLAVIGLFRWRRVGRSL